MHNFNKERLQICCGVNRNSRTLYRLAFEYALTRKTFGKTLMKHQIIRFKLAEMARLIESCHDSLERVYYQYKCGVPDTHLGG